MKITADANIFFAALIKDSTTRKLWFNGALKLFAPEFLMQEFFKHTAAVKKKFSGTPEEFETLVEELLNQVELIPDKELVPFLPAVASLVSDEKDWLYAACALKEDTAIWSHDKELKKQTRIQIYTTSELIEKTGTL